MTTITIPKKIDKNQELVVIPKKAFEEFLAWQKKIGSIKTFTPTASERKALARARKNLAKSEYLTLDELRKSLGIKNR